jgi:hypothetical protein
MPLLDAKKSTLTLFGKRHIFPPIVAHGRSQAAMPRICG